MSSFFPFGLNIGASETGFFPVPSSGCPLGKHPSWNRVVGVGDSVFCWESADGRTISVNGTDDVVKNLAFSNLYAVDGMITCKIAYIPSGSDNWLLPMATRMINSNNLLGCRWNGALYEIVQRRNGIWNTLWSGGTPAIDDEVKFIVSGNTWKLYVNNNLLANGTTNIALSEGYFGVSQHRSGTLDGHTILTDFDVSLGKVTLNDIIVTNDGFDVVYFEEV